MVINLSLKTSILKRAIAFVKKNNNNATYIQFISYIYNLFLYSIYQQLG